MCFTGAILSKSYVKWREADGIGEDCLSKCVCVCVCVETERDRERERGGGERQTSLCGTTVLVLLMQYSRLVLCKSFLCECKCSKISNFWLDKSLNLIIPAAAFFITSFLAQLNQFMVFFRYIIFLFFFYYCYCN